MRLKHSFSADQRGVALVARAGVNFAFFHC
jgi:hypothetical protein